MPSYVVTGAARRSGIGFGFVRKLSADPNNVVFALVRRLATAQAAIELASTARNVHVFEADVVDEKALAAAAAEVARVTGGSLDVLINNAGVQDLGCLGVDIDGFPSFEALKKDLFSTAEVNIYGVMVATLTFIPLLQRGTLKKVVSISSAMCDVEFITGTGMTTSVSYAISKGGLNVAMAKFAARYKADGLVFLSICPGLTATDHISPDSLPPEEWATIAKQIAAVRRLDPGFRGPHSVEYAVDRQLEVIGRWAIERSGAFVSHKGDRSWL